jgi:hypothetical protein
MLRRVLVLKMKRINLLWILALLLLSFASASDGCFVNENCTWWATITSGAELYDVDSATLTIVNPTGNIVATSEAMTEVQIGTFIYQYSHNLTGNYLGYTQFIKDGLVVSTASQSLQVKIKEIGASSPGANMEGILLLLAIFAIGCVLLFAAYKVQIEDYGVLNLFLIICAVIAFLLVPKVALDYNDHCSLVPTNMTSGDTGAVVYSYDYVCAENENSTARTFYVFMTWIARILTFYAFMYGLYKLYSYIKDRTKW